MSKGYLKTIIFIMILMILTSCSLEKSTTIDKPIYNTEKPGAPESKTYPSITAFQDEINGINLKTSHLEIMKSGNTVNLKMRIFFTNQLRDKLLKTEKPFFFTFADVEGNDKIVRLLTETPSLIHIELTENENLYTLSQNLKVKENLSAEEEKTLLSPENYELQVVNEEELAVAIFIGLEDATLN